MMPDQQQWRVLAADIEARCGERVDAQSATRVHGGCIHTALCVASGRRRLFLKLNQASMADNFSAEQAGLEALAATATVRVPVPLGRGVSGELAWLAMEWFNLSSGAGAEAERELGLALAALHENTAPGFGFHSDNALGASHQPNAWCDSWPDFLRRRRLGYQLRLAAANGYTGALQELGAQVLERLGKWPAAHIRPALIHGDLWGGNWGVLADGAAVMFDPAVCYADPEAEIAMTELFGGFGTPFYEAYRSVHPEPHDGELRRSLYALYHVLNHLNLFGGSYLGQAITLLRRLQALTCA